MNPPALIDFSVALVINATLLLALAQLIDLTLSRGRMGWMGWMGHPSIGTNLLIGLLVGLICLLLIRVSTTSGSTTRSNAIDWSRSSVRPAT